MPDKNSVRGRDAGRGLLQDFVQVSVGEVVGSGGSVKTTVDGAVVARGDSAVVLRPRHGWSGNFLEERVSMSWARILGDKIMGRVDWLQCACKKIRAVQVEMALKFRSGGAKCLV